MFGNTTAEINQATAQWQKLMVDSWSQWTAKTVSSESFAAASGAYMDWALSSQKMMTEMSGQLMETLDVPRRSDLARIAAQVQSVETRLLDHEDSQAELRDLLLAINSKLDALSPKASTTATVAAKTVKADAPTITTKAPRKSSKKGGN